MGLIQGDTRSLDYSSYERSQKECRLDDRCKRGAVQPADTPKP